MIGFAEKSSAFTMDMHMMHAQAWMRMPVRGFGPRSKPFRGGGCGERYTVEGYLDRDPGLVKRFEGGMREEGGRSSKADAEGRTDDDMTRARTRTCEAATLLSSVPREHPVCRAGGISPLAG